MGLSSLNGEKSFSSRCDGTYFSCLLCSYSESATHKQRQEHQCPIWFYEYLSRPLSITRSHLTWPFVLILAAPTERHTDFEDYKANRQGCTRRYSLSNTRYKKIIKGFNIPVLELDGYEADDVIGTLCKQGEKSRLRSLHGNT